MTFSPSSCIVHDKCISNADYGSYDRAETVATEHKSDCWCSLWDIISAHSHITGGECSVNCTIFNGEGTVQSHILGGECSVQSVNHSIAFSYAQDDSNGNIRRLRGDLQVYGQEHPSGECSVYF